MLPMLRLRNALQLRKNACVPLRHVCMSHLFFFPSFLECAIAAADAAAADDDNTRDLLLLPPAACWPLASPCPRVPGVPPSS